jgi:TonB family protein
MGSIGQFRCGARLFAAFAFSVLNVAFAAASFNPSAASVQQGRQAVVQDASKDSDERPLPPGVYRAGEGVSAPRVVRDVSPQYTPGAMRAAIHGVVRLDCVVGVDGAVGDVRVVRSLDSIYGLDDEAVKAAKQWKFEPGKKDDVAVPVMVTIDMTFAMSASVPAATSRHNTHR